MAEIKMLDLCRNKKKMYWLKCCNVKKKTKKKLKKIFEFLPCYLFAGENRHLRLIIFPGTF